jgi:hypothetical protein
MYLGHLVLGRLVEDGVQQRDPLNQHLRAADFNAVTDVIRVLHKKENAGTEELLGGDGKDE